MSDNPYSPPGDAPVNVERKRSHICATMFWLSCVLCLIAMGIAANGVYQYWFYTSQIAIPLPTSILVESLIVACSGLGMFYFAATWRRQAIRAGAILFACSLLAFLVGPFLV